MSKEYEVVLEFRCQGELMVIVRIGNTAHVMSQKEWCKICDRNRQEKRKAKID